MADENRARSDLTPGQKDLTRVGTGDQSVQPLNSGSDVSVSRRRPSYVDMTVAEFGCLWHPLGGFPGSLPYFSSWKVVQPSDCL